MCQKSAGLPRSEQGLTRFIVDNGKTVRIGNALEDSWVRDSVKNEGTQSILGVPMQVKGERVGVLLCQQ